MVQNVAGEDTNLNLGFTFKASLTITLAAGGLMVAKLRAQRKRLQEQRETIKKHEKRNVELDRENTQLKRRIEQIKGQGDDPKRKRRR